MEINRKNIAVENAHIRYRNFSGEEKTFNPQGRRNFTLMLDEEARDIFLRDGYNVRNIQPRDENSDPEYSLEVTVSFKNKPPRIWQITSRNKVLLNEETVGDLDYAEIANIDLTISPYPWTMPGGRSGVKAYLSSMYVTLVEDEFFDKYADIPSSGGR